MFSEKGTVTFFCVKFKIKFTLNFSSSRLQREWLLTYQ